MGELLDGRGRLVDHRSSANNEWRELLHHAENVPVGRVISPESQLQWFRGPFSGWQLSQDLYNFVIGFLGSTMYGRRRALAGIEGNGFELLHSLD